MSLVGFILVYGLLGIVDFYLIADFAKKGPVEDSMQPPGQRCKGQQPKRTSIRDRSD